VEGDFGEGLMGWGLMTEGWWGGEGFGGFPFWVAGRGWLC